MTSTLTLKDRFRRALRRGAGYYLSRGYLAQRLLGYHTQELYVYEQMIDDFCLRAEPKIPITVRQASSWDDLAGFLARRPNFVEEYWQRLAKGDICLLATAHDKAVSCLWAEFDNVYLTDVQYRLPLDHLTAALIDAYTLQEFQCNRIYSALWVAMISELKARGYKRALGFISPENETSLAVHRKLGLTRMVLIIKMTARLGRTYHNVRLPGDIF